MAVTFICWVLLSCFGGCAVLLCLPAPFSLKAAQAFSSSIAWVTSAPGARTMAIGIFWKCHLCIYLWPVALAMNDG